MHIVRRQGNFDKMGSIEVKICSKKPHSVCTIGKIFIAVYRTVWRKKLQLIVECEGSGSVEIL